MRIPFPRTKGAWIRLFLSLAMVLLVAYYMSLTITNRVAIESRINAEVVPQVAHIDGLLIGELPQRGQRVRKGEVLALIRSERVDDRTLTELRQSLYDLSASIASRTAERAELAAEHDALAAQRSRHTELMRERLVAIGSELQASLKIAQEDRFLAAQALQRGQTLQKTGTISVAQHENLLHNHEKAIANTARIEALIAQNKTDQAAIVHGVTLSGNYADIPYTSQRMDEIRMKLIAIDSELRNFSERTAHLRERLDAETRRVAKLTEQAFVSPVDGVIWRRRDPVGQEILRGTSVLDIIDCNRTFVEATVYERFLSRIEVGKTARIKMLGDDRKFTAQVTSIMGSAINIHTNGNVAVPLRKNPGEATVILNIEHDDQRSNVSMCGVGRTADVSFSDVGLIATARAAIQERAEE